MNGLELHEEIMKLTAELEKAPRWALAYALASSSIYSRMQFAPSAEVAISAARCEILPHVQEACKTARIVAHGRRMERLIQKIDQGLEDVRRS